ncbi:MAG: hypothetical protein JST75_00455 [Bacteroidetes bacterium]|nr:hypothetical protein [Bacteroidota bacterium]
MLTKADIEKYFLAEKHESLMFLVVGIIAIVLSLIFYSYLKTNFYKGAAIPLLVIGIAQAVVGYTVYARSDEQRIGNVYAYDMDPGKLKMQEFPRMQTVNKNFVIYRWIEIAFLIAGGTLIFLYRNDPDKIFWFGLGITLVIQAALLLIADQIAAQRASVYTSLLEKFINNKAA